MSINIYGLGTIINVVAIAVAGVLGKLIGSLLKESMQDSLMKACGISTMFLGIAGALEGMLTVSGEKVASGGSMLIIGSLLLGTLIGEIFDFEGLLERFGEWLKIKSGNGKEKEFVNAFLTATFTVCIGAMAVVGSIEDGITGDYSLLVTKSILDFIIILVMTSTMGKGCAFSAIPVGIFQGGVTLMAKFIKPVLTDLSLGNLSMVGSILIFCVGVNLVWGKKIKVANMLPAIIFAVAFAFV